MLDYEALRMVWWALLGLLLIGIAVMDGFDLGTAILLPFLGRTDNERRVVINTIGPVWEGNQVWLILGGGAIFAAWPPLYAVAFSGFYFAMLLLLWSLILRPVGFKFRGKLPGAGWRATWDWALFIGGFVPALVYGVAFGNVLQGVPFTFDESLRLTYSGTLLGLFNPFALLSGVLSVAMLVLHGAVWLSGKTDAAVRDRARRVVPLAGGAVIVLFGLGGLWAGQLDGYVISHFAGTAGPSDPLAKTVARQAGALLANYHEHGWMLVAPALGFAGAVGAIVLTVFRSPRLAWLASALAIAGVISTAGVSLFPFMLPSSLNPAASLTVWDASSSRMTLWVMTLVTAVLLPVVIAYTAYIYRVLQGPVTQASIIANPHSY
jgi:cytochrome d ubiquinol oxidase subunit II